MGFGMKKNLLKILAIFIIGMIGGIFADQILWPYFVERPLFYQYGLDQKPIYVTERKEITIQENVALQNSIEKVDKTVIGVKTKTEEKILEGSGLILTSDGLIITLASLIPQGYKFSFFVDGELTHYQVLKRDLKENLALVKLEKNNLPTVSFANFEKIKLGERVFLVGAVFKEGEMKKVTNEGIVKYFDKDLIETNIFETNLLRGSPLFNIKGEVLGLNAVDFWGRIIVIPVSKIKSFAGF